MGSVVTKRSLIMLMAWVVVIPKEGRVCMAASALLLVWYWLFRFYLFIYLFIFFFFWKVGVIPKEGWARPCAPILLVWHRLKPLGTFWRDAAQSCDYCITSKQNLSSHPQASHLFVLCCDGVYSFTPTVQMESVCIRVFADISVNIRHINTGFSGECLGSINWNWCTPFSGLDDHTTQAIP